MTIEQKIAPPDVAGLVLELPDAAVALRNDGNGSLADAVSNASTALTALSARVAELQKYCFAAAHDYSGLVDLFRGADAEWSGHPAYGAFFKTIKEFAETAQFMAMASDLKADPKMYDDALVSAKRDKGQAERDLAAARRNAESWKHEYEIYSHAWEREIGPPYANKRHRIDCLVLTTQWVRAEAARVPGLLTRIAELERAEETKRLDNEYGSQALAQKDGGNG